MDFKKEYKKLVGTVKSTRKGQKLSFRNEDIAGILGYSRTYFSGLLGKSAIVTQDHLKNLKLHFPFLSENHTSNLLNEEQAKYINRKSVDAGKEIGRLKEKEIYHSAAIAVLEQMVDKLVSDHTGTSIALVSGERKQATEMEAKRLFDEERKKHKQSKI